MKKVLFSVVSLMASVSAFAEYSFDNAFWIIKDGKMTDNVSVWEYDKDDLATKVPSEIVNTTVDGEDVVVYKQLSEDYLDVRLKFNENNPVSMENNYVLMLEYKIPASHAENKLIDGNKPLWIFGYASSETNLKANNASHAEAYTMIDAKWGAADEWVTTYKYIYSPASLKTLYGMNFTYAREYRKGDMSEFPCVKNMALISLKEGKPFYAENFDGYGLGEFYLEKNDITLNRCSFLGGKKPVVTDDCYDITDELGIEGLTAFRDFLADSIKNQDGSGYIDCEILHALQVESFRDSIVFENIPIPSGVDTIYSSMIIKKHKNEKNYWNDAPYEEYSNADLPILLRFSTGETVDLANDTIKNIWTEFKGQVAVPNGATTVDLVIKAGLAGYLIDNITFSGNKLSDKVSQKGADSFEVIAYVDENGDIVVVNGELVATYNMEGKVASKDDKAVVIIVKNDKGQYAAKVMLKK